MNKEDILDIIEYQFGEEIRREVEKLNIQIKKFKSRKIEIYFKDKLFLTLNPKFFLFSVAPEFAKLLKKQKKFYVKIKKEFLNEINKTHNIIRKNVIDFSKDFRFGDDVIILDENDNLIAIAKAKFNHNEIENASYGVIAKIKKKIKD